MIIYSTNIIQLSLLNIIVASKVKTEFYKPKKVRTLPPPPPTHTKKTFQFLTFVKTPLLLPHTWTTPVSCRGKWNEEFLLVWQKCSGELAEKSNQKGECHSHLAPPTPTTSALWSLSQLQSNVDLRQGDSKYNETNRVLEGKIAFDLTFLDTLDWQLLSFQKSKCAKNHWLSLTKFTENCQTWTRRWMICPSIILMVKARLWDLHWHL